MNEIRARLREALHRAGLSSVPPSVLAVALVIALLGIGLGLHQWWPRSEGIVVSAQDAAASAPSVAEPSGPVESDSSGGRLSAEPAAAQAESASGAPLFVHVVGAVRHPGLYEVAAGSRVADVIEKAGGLLGNAAERGLNLARPVMDGEQVVVMTQDEFAADPSGGSQAAAGPGPAGGAAAPSSASGGLVNVNTADVALLDTLPGVGPSTAEKIVAEREANGPFTSVEDLTRVPGIGPKKLEALRDLVVTR